jgi:hypothetical protein
MIVGRLAAQWPSIADSDLGAQDWVNAVAALPWERAARIADELLHGWTRDRPPRLADWQEAARQAAARERLAERREALGEPAANPDVVAALIAQARARLSAARAARPRPRRASRPAALEEDW